MEHRAVDAVPAEPLSRALEREHREIDDVIKRCLGAAVTSPEAGAALERAVAELRWHIYVEEELLFPPLHAAGMTGPILVMLREHGQMWPILDTLDQALRGEVDQGTLRNACRQLLVLLQHHNPKEEKILYPQVDQVLGADASGAVREFLTGGRVPADWTCQHLRPRRTSGQEAPAATTTSTIERLPSNATKRRSSTMAIAERTAETTWKGALARGRGTVRPNSGAFDVLPVTWAARTEAPEGKTSPEELAAAAHSSCFAMALTLCLEERDAHPEELTVSSTVTLDEVDGRPTIVSSALVVHGRVPGLDAADFQTAVDEAAALCPISRLFAGADITISSALEPM